ncbi:MAG: response regulator [Gemmatimonadales bacterium]
MSHPEIDRPNRRRAVVQRDDTTQRPFIAIIEDDAEFRAMLVELLDDEGYHAVPYANGADALEHLRDSAQTGTLPQVILLDLSMPVMDGVDFLRHRSDDPRLAAVPVVLVTNAKPHERPTAGVSDVVRKPIDIDEILFAIRRYCA